MAFPTIFKASCYYVIPFSKILPRIPAYCFLAFGFMILKGNFYCEWSRFGHMPGANRREKKEGFIFCSLPQFPSTQLPGVFSSPNTIWLSIQLLPPSPQDTKDFHDAHSTHQYNFTHYSLFRSPKFLVVSNWLLSSFPCISLVPHKLFSMPGVPSPISSCSVQMFPPLCCLISSLPNFFPSTNIQSFNKQILRLWAQLLLLYQLHVIASICF